MARGDRWIRRQAADVSDRPTPWSGWSGVWWLVLMTLRDGRPGGEAGRMLFRLVACLAVWQSVACSSRQEAAGAGSSRKRRRTTDNPDCLDASQLSRPAGGRVGTWIPFSNLLRGYRWHFRIASHPFACIPSLASHRIPHPASLRYAHQTNPLTPKPKLNQTARHGAEGSNRWTTSASAVCWSCSCSCS